MYKRKTEDEYEVQGWFGSWECVYTATTMKEAREIRRDYNQNTPNAYRIIKRRVPIAALARPLIQ